MAEELRRVHTSAIPVRWGDLDAFGHVNNVQYFRFMEQCRVEWLESLNLFPKGPQSPADAKDATHHIMPVVASLSCNYKVPVHYPSALAVSLFTGKIGRTSLQTWHEIRSADSLSLFADGAATLVWIDVRTGRPVPLPESVRRAAAD